MRTAVVVAMQLTLSGVAGCSRTALDDDGAAPTYEGAAPTSPTGERPACEVSSAAPEDEWNVVASGSGTPWSRAIAVDAWGGIAVTGSFSGIAKILESPVVSYGDFDAFLVKLTSGGDVAWRIAIGGTGHDSGEDVAFAADGSVLFAGNVASSDVNLQGLPAGFAGGGVVVKLDPCGKVIWSRALSGVQNGQPLRLAVDASGHVYVGGTFAGRLRIDGDRSIGEIDRAQGSSDAFLAKLDADGNLAWVRRLGGPGRDTFDDLDLDPGTERIYATNTVEGAFDLAGARVNAGTSVLLVSMTPGGDMLAARALGPARDGDGGGARSSTVATGPTGTVVVSAVLEGSIVVGNAELTSTSYNDCFVSAFDRSGEPLWSRVIRNGTRAALAVDSWGRTFAGGWALGLLTIGDRQMTTHGDYDGFLTVLDGAGSPISAELFGGFATDGSMGIAVDDTRRATIVTGVFGSQFTIDGFALSPIPADGMNTFVLRRSMADPQ